MSEKIIAVTGATGTQGGSVATVLAGAGWKVRAITRNVDSDKAKKLKAAGAEVVTADYDNKDSLKKAFEGATAVFGLTNWWEHRFKGASAEAAGEKEEQQGMNIAHAVNETPSVQHYVWHSLAPASDLTKGKYPVPHFDWKAKVDDRIRKELPDLAKKTTYLYNGWYPENWAFAPLCKPIPLTHPMARGKYFIPLAAAPDSKIASAGDMSLNPGVFVRQILANPEVSKGKYSQVRTHIPTFKEQVEVVSKVTGKEIVYVEISTEAQTQMWGWPGEEMAAQMKFGEQISDWEKGLHGQQFVGAEELGIKPGDLRDDFQRLTDLKPMIIS